MSRFPPLATSQSPWEPYITRAKQFTSFSKLTTWYQPFQTFAEFGSLNSGSGAGPNYNASYNQCMQVTSGATASSQGIARVGTGAPSFMPQGTAAKWYMRARFAVITAIDAQAYCGYFTTGSSFKMGAFGTSALASGSNTNFVCFVSGGSAGTITSTVAIDTNFHTHEVWFAGDGSVRYAVDGEAIQSSTSFIAGTAGTGDSFYWIAGNGTTAAARTVIHDECFMAIDDPV